MEALFSISGLFAKMSSIIYDAKKNALKRVLCIIIFHMASCVWPCAVNGVLRIIYHMNISFIEDVLLLTCFFPILKDCSNESYLLIVLRSIEFKIQNPITTTSISERPPPCRTLRSSSSTRLTTTWAQKYQTTLFKKLFSLCLDYNCTV